MPVNRYQPTPHQAALLLLKLLEARPREQGNLSRARLGENTLLRLWNRSRLKAGFLEEVQEWLHLGGWALIDAGTTYAAVKIDAVETWPGVSSKRIRNILDEVIEGSYDFAQLEALITEPDDDKPAVQKP